MQEISQLYQLYSEYHKKMAFSGNPHSLYDSMNYIMDLGGKRARPLLTLAATFAVNQKVEIALPLAWSIEGFHNFSLVHDDIMDNASVRRGKPTVHEKYDVNTAILCGDNLLVKVMEHVVLNHSLEVSKLFFKTSAEICEGQQMDMEFALRNDVTFEAYMEMIRLKTAVLLGCAAKGGALIGGAAEPDAEIFYDFAIQLGLAFQLKDDLLDTFGDEALTGKKVGGDIQEAKKNALYILSRQKSAEIDTIYAIESFPERIDAAIKLFHQQGIQTEIESIIQKYEQGYEHSLTALKHRAFDVSLIEELCMQLSNRNS